MWHVDYIINFIFYFFKDTRGICPYFFKKNYNINSGFFFSNFIFFVLKIKNELFNFENFVRK